MATKVELQAALDYAQADTRTCGFCKANHPRIRLMDGTFAHEFQNPEHPGGPIAWAEPCADSTRYENE